MYIILPKILDLNNKWKHNICSNIIIHIKRLINFLTKKYIYLIDNLMENK
jgi:hypothetical protein